MYLTIPPLTTPSLTVGALSAAFGRMTLISPGGVTRVTTMYGAKQWPEELRPRLGGSVECTVATLCARLDPFSPDDHTEKFGKRRSVIVPRIKPGATPFRVKIAGASIAGDTVIEVECLDDEDCSRVYIDTLTGLGSRYSLMTYLPRLIFNARRTDREKGVLLCYIDLDGFKQLNDSWGHDFGDEVLRAFARRLRDSTEGHLAFRSGGDEFVVATWPMFADQAALYAGYLEEVVNRAPYGINGAQVPLKASFGAIWSPCSRDTDDARYLLGAGDRLMYEAKTARKAGDTGRPERWFEIR